MASRSDDTAPFGGLGDYDSSDLTLSRMTARTYFLDAVVRLEPKVIETLADAPYAAYVPLRDRLDSTRDLRSGGLSDFWLWPMARSAPADLVRTTVPLQDALIAWGQRWHLTDDWCLTIALHTLSLWWVYRLPAGQPVPEDFAEFSWSDWLPTVLSFAEERDPAFAFAFSHRRWEPTETPRAVVRRAIRAAFETQLTAYLDRMEALARERGFVPAAHKAERHFEWLALYQVGTRSPAQIAQAFGKERAAVDAAIRATADLIGLTLRPSARGGARPVKRARTIVARRRTGAN